MVPPRAARALERAFALASAPWLPFSGQASTPSRWFVLGDPQAPASKLFEVLEAHDLLGDDGWLARGVGLVSIGDHYDYKCRPDELAEVGRNGSAFLAWLAAHAPSQVVIVAGNHDLCRVMESLPSRRMSRSLAFESSPTCCCRKRL
ncbi:MAG: hypothetical protein U0165_09215 [Polyangiaceae bacterium]